MPLIKIPGLFELESVALGVAEQTSKDITIEGHELVMKGGMDNLEDVNKRIKFHQNSVLTWDDDSIHMEMKVDYGIDPPEHYRMMMPVLVFEGFGRVVNGTILDTNANAFMDVMEREYGEWANAKVP